MMDFMDELEAAQYHSEYEAYLDELEKDQNRMFDEYMWREDQRQMELPFAQGASIDNQF